MTAQYTSRPGGSAQSPGSPGFNTTDFLVVVGLAPWLLDIVLTLYLFPWRLGWTEENLIRAGVASVVVAIAGFPAFVPWTRSSWTWARMRGVLLRAGITNHRGEPPACVWVWRWRGSVIVRLRCAGQDYKTIEARIDLIADELRVAVMSAEKRGRTVILRGRKRSAHRVSGS